MTKKLTVCVCSLCLISALCFTACGSSYAKIKGIGAGIGTEETEAFEYNNALRNAQTVFNHDYILRTNAEYIFGVTYYASGGSIYPVMNAENIKLFYDESILEIVQTSDNLGQEIYYRLICKKSVTNTAIVAEVGEYTCTVVISAE